MLRLAVVTVQTLAGTGWKAPWMASTAVEGKNCESRFDPLLQSSQRKKRLANVRHQSYKLLSENHT